MWKPFQEDKSTTSASLSARFCTHFLFSLKCVSECVCVRVSDERAAHREDVLHSAVMKLIKHTCVTQMEDVCVSVRVSL